jgi:two-component system, NarL family, nitrate/nitrite response regulator NarL
VKSVIPVVVTHPCTLFRDGLRHILAGTRFRTAYLADEFDETVMRHLSSDAQCLWLMGLSEGHPPNFENIIKVVTGSTGSKVVVLSQRRDPSCVLPALNAGASGFLDDNINGERLVKTLEVIVLGEIVVPVEFFKLARTSIDTSIKSQGAIQSLSPRLTSDSNGHSNGNGHGNGHSHGNGNGNGNGRAHGPALLSAPASTSMPPPAPDDFDRHDGSSQAAERISGASIGLADARTLSKREESILRLLMEGGSNKMIARRLVITEATVKVHIKAILRKLRLHNRTQAAMWAYNNLQRPSTEANGNGSGNGSANGGEKPTLAHLSRERH